MSLSEKLSAYGPWALVTGASSGIGEQFARKLADAGLNLLLVARRTDRLQALKDELFRRYGTLVELIGEDLAQPDAADRVVSAIGERDVGLVVSNAGFGLKGGFSQHDASTLDAMLNVNARAPLLLLHALLPRLKARTRAGIILTGSMEGEAAFPWSAAYAATKAFLHSLGAGLYGELQGSGVDLLVLAPGSTETEAHALQGISREALMGVMSPAAVATAALEQLGRRPLYVPGWYNAAFVCLLRLLPRRWAVWLAGKGMATTLARSGHPVQP